MKDLLQKLQEEFDEKYGMVFNLDNDGNPTFECTVEVKDFLTQSNLRVIEKVKEILKKHRGIYGMGNIDDVYLELSTLIEQK